MGKSRDIADSAATINFIDNVTSDVQGQINAIDTDPTLGTLTKTFVTNEQATISLSSAPTGQPVVSVSKEVPQTGTTNDYWDVNSTEENYTRTNSAPATTLDFEAYTISSAISAGSFVTTPNETTPTGVTFNADGTKMYVIGQGGEDVNEYNLSTAFDVTTAVHVTDVLSVAGQTINPNGLVFNDDGTKLFVFDSNVIYRYGLTTAYDTTTGSYDNQSLTTTSTTPFVYDVVFNPDGTKMFCCSTSADTIDEYTLSTAYDLTTASKVDGLSVLSGGEEPRGFDFSSDGTRLFVASNQDNAVYEWSLGTAFDISTGTITTNSFNFITDTTSPYDLMFNSDGNRMYILSLGGDFVFQYDLAYSLAILGTGSFASADVGKTIEANGGEFVLTAADGSFVETTALTSYNQVASGDWEMYAVVYNTTDGDLELSGGRPYTLDGASYDSISFPVGTQEASPYGVAFNTDGTKMFIVGLGGDEVNEYALSTAWDISTASSSALFPVSGQDLTPLGIAFNNDGTKMFIAGSTNETIFQYTLTTGFDVSTASYASISFSVLGQGTDPRGIAFNNDGTKMFVVDSGTAVNMYVLSTAFNVSTAVYSGTSLDTSFGIMSGISFSPDGTVLLLTNNDDDRVYEYILSTGFDLSTASLSRTFDVSAQNSNPLGIAVGNNGLKLYIAGLTNDTVYQYSIGGFSFALSGYHAVHTINSTDSTYWTDLNSMTVDEAAGGGSIYYAVSTDDRTTWAVIDNTNGVRDIVRNNLGTWQYNSNTTYASTTWTAGTTNTELATLEEAMEVSEVTNPYNISPKPGASLTKSFDISPDIATAISMVFNSDGTKLFISDQNTTDIAEYALSTAWDITTASYTTRFLLTSQMSQSQGLTFNNDGTRMFVLSTAGTDAVFQYNLTTGFDISTASYSGNTRSVGTQDTVPRELRFNADGTVMIVAGQSGNALYEYTLATGFDLSSTFTFVDSFSLASELTATTPQALHFDSAGTTVWVGDTGGDVFKYTLSSGFDVSSMSFSESVTYLTGTVQGLFFNTDGSKFFVLDNDNKLVMEYIVATFVYHNQMDKTQLEAVTDPNHYTLGNSLDLAIIFNQTAVGLAPSSDGVSINYDANTLQKGAINGTDYEWDYPASDKVRITALAPANLKVRVV